MRSRPVQTGPTGLVRPWVVQTGGGLDHFGPGPDRFNRSRSEKPLCIGYTILQTRVTETDSLTTPRHIFTYEAHTIHESGKRVRRPSCHWMATRWYMVGSVRSHIGAWKLACAPVIC